MQFYRFFNLTCVRYFDIACRPINFLFGIFSGILSGNLSAIVCGLLFSVPAAIADTGELSDELIIVTDIAPIHSLVSMVIGEQTDVKLLIPPSQSPHSFSLRPSQTRTISQANLIVILSNDFTPMLSRHLKSIDKSAVVLELSGPSGNHQVNETVQLEHANDLQINSDDHNVAKRDENKISLNKAAKQRSYDAHTWLNPENAIVWIDRIANTAIKLDEKNSDIYKGNASRAKADLMIMHKEFISQLKSVRSAHYIVYHDAYQHFAQSYGLQEPIAIALSDARVPGAKKLRAMRAKAKQTQCVFSELQYDDTIVDTVTADLPVKRATLDPIGGSIPIGPNHYPQTMQALVNSFVNCLN